MEPAPAINQREAAVQEVERPARSPRQMESGHSAVIRKQLDWLAEAAHRIFADALESSPIAPTARPACAGW